MPYVIFIERVVVLVAKESHLDAHLPRPCLSGFFLKFELLGFKLIVRKLYENLDLLVQSYKTCEVP